MLKIFKQCHDKIWGLNLHYGTNSCPLFLDLRLCRESVFVALEFARLLAASLTIKGQFWGENWGAPL